MKQYGVVNMDIVGSRKVKDRSKLLASISRCINLINEKYGSILPAPITITLGDEWQLITDKPEESYNLVHEFQQLLWAEDIELYAGIGIGALSTPVFEDIRKMDGACFHMARNAIHIAKNVDKLKSKYSVTKLNKVFFVPHLLPDDRMELDILSMYFTSKARSSETAADEVAAVREEGPEGPVNSDYFNGLLLGRTINLLIENNEILKSKMTDKQRHVYVRYSTLKSYRKVIQAMGEDTKETTGSISQKLNSASYFTIQRNQQMVSVLLNSYCNMGV